MSLSTSLYITRQTLRRFILGKQGLWPGRRWRGKAGLAAALQAGCVIQVDPLCVTARSHDIACFSRVLDYRPELLNALLYGDRAGFDYGGVVMVHAMHSLPYWRVVMERVGLRRAYLYEQNREAVEEVTAMLRERGPLANRDFTSPKGQKQYWHAAKSSAQALYFLWLNGNLMTHSRRNFERLYDLTERIAPQAYQRVASAEEAEAYFALQAFQEKGALSIKDWRAFFIGAVERKISPDEATGWVQSLLETGKIAPVEIEGENASRYVASGDVPLLDALQSGRIPADWQPLETSTEEEAVFLAPLEIVSARGRAKELFGFEYLWEVYKPAEARRWGYYVLPVLYGDRLVARFDSQVDRQAKRLTIKRLWLEEGVALDGKLKSALAKGFERFMQLAGVERIEGDFFAL